MKTKKYVSVIVGLFMALSVAFPSSGYTHDTGEGTATEETTTSQETAPTGGETAPTDEGTSSTDGGTVPSKGAAEPRFKDVYHTDRTYEQIIYLTDREIIFGTNEGYFLPRENVTRAAAAAFIGRTFKFDGTVRNTKFPDVSSNVYASGYIEELSKHKIISGYPDGTYKPGKSINRGEAAIMIARAFKLGTVTNSAQAAELLVKNGIAQGKVDGTFGGLETITRQDFAVFLANAMKLGVPTWECPQTDLTCNKQTIIIDPGHGGTDPGAVGYNDLKEKDVVLDISKQVNTLFMNTPFTPKMTRYNDEFLSLKQRVDYAKQNKGHVFVSIHANSFNGSANGTETYYYTASTNPYTSDSKLLAEKIQARLLQALQLRNRGVKNAGFYVIKYNSMPAALAELGFIDNQTDAEKLASKTYRASAAKAIYLGILDFYEAKGYDVSAYKK